MVRKRRTAKDDANFDAMVAATNDGDTYIDALGVADQGDVRVAIDRACPPAKKTRGRR